MAPTVHSTQADAHIKLVERLKSHHLSLLVVEVASFDIRKSITPKFKVKNTSRESS